MANRGRRAQQTGPAQAPCVCGSGESFDRCCQRLHEGASAATAEALMRSRYSAFALRDADYLLRSWDSRTRPAVIDFDPELSWQRLDIVGTSGGRLFDSTGIVEFRASFSRRGRNGRHDERSAFRREGGEWVYVGVEER